MNEKQASFVAQIAGLSSLPIAELWPVRDRHFSSRPINPKLEHRIVAQAVNETGTSGYRAGIIIRTAITDLGSV